jgi:hypothetical protein
MNGVRSNSLSRPGLEGDRCWRKIIFDSGFLNVREVYGDEENVLLSTKKTARKVSGVRSLLIDIMVDHEP